MAYSNAYVFQFNLYLKYYEQIMDLTGNQKKKKNTLL